MSVNSTIDFYIHFNAHKLNILKPDYIISEIYYLLNKTPHHNIEKELLIKNIYERLRIKYNDFKITEIFCKLL